MLGGYFGRAASLPPGMLRMGAVLLCRGSRTAYRRSGRLCVRRVQRNIRARGVHGDQYSTAVDEIDLR